MITLTAKRDGENVNLYKSNGELKAVFPKTGYRPTKATKKVTLNCFNYKIIWE